MKYPIIIRSPLPRFLFFPNLGELGEVKIAVKNERFFVGPSRRSSPFWDSFSSLAPRAEEEVKIAVKKKRICQIPARQTDPLLLCSRVLGEVKDAVKYG